MGRRKKIGIRRLKNEASRTIHEVRERGTEYVVTHRDQPVAILRPLETEDTEADREARIAAVMTRLRRTASRIGALASDESAAAAVSRQRR